MLKFIFILFKLSLSSSRCMNGGIFVLENFTVVRYNVWITESTWLPDLSKYSLVLIRQWGVLMEPREHCSTILLPKPSQNFPRVSPNSLGAKLRHWVNARSVALPFSPRHDPMPSLACYLLAHLYRHYPSPLCWFPMWPTLHPLLFLYSWAFSTGDSVCSHLLTLVTR
jgi:hypothetical protein